MYSREGRSWMKMDWVFWSQSTVIVIFGTLGALLFQLGVKQMGGIDPLSLKSWVGLVSTPAIFFGLASLMFSRLLFSLPLARMGIGKFSALIIPLNIIAIAISSAIIFKEPFETKQILGIALGLVAIILIGAE